jgi:hypothetical protein
MTIAIENHSEETPNKMTMVTNTNIAITVTIITITVTIITITVVVTRTRASRTRASKEKLRVVSLNRKPKRSNSKIKQMVAFLSLFSLKCCVINEVINQI